MLNNCVIEEERGESEHAWWIITIYCIATFFKFVLTVLPLNYGKKECIWQVYSPNRI